jgi:hypothetical protein
MSPEASLFPYRFADVLPQALILVSLACGCGLSHDHPARTTRAAGPVTVGQEIDLFPECSAGDDLDPGVALRWDLDHGPTDGPENPKFRLLRRRGEGRARPSRPVETELGVVEITPDEVVFRTHLELLKAGAAPARSDAAIGASSVSVRVRNAGQIAEFKRGGVLEWTRLAPGCVYLAHWKQKQKARKVDCGAGTVYFVVSDAEAEVIDASGLTRSWHLDLYAEREGELAYVDLEGRHVVLVETEDRLSSVQGREHGARVVEGLELRGANERLPLPVGRDNGLLLLMEDYCKAFVFVEGIVEHF